MYEELKYWYLRDHKLFWTLNMSQIKQLCIITGFKKASKGEIIYFSSSDVPRIFLLKKGNIKIISLDDDGNETIKDIIQKGDLFGELTLESDKNSNEYAKALTDDFSWTELKLYLFNEFWLTYQSKINELAVYGDGICENLERSIILINIDRIWREHLQKMTLLREAVGWRGYGQRNPLYEYKQEAFYLFENRKKVLRHVVIYDLLRSAIL